jgi:hypothetical protein
LATALRRAVHVGDKALLLEVLESKAELSSHLIDPPKNVRVIHLACKNEDSGLVKLLVDHGADIDA